MLPLYMSNRVTTTKKCQKLYSKCPSAVKVAFDGLLDELEIKGPVLPDRPNYSKLGKYTYHCHLFYSWVATWRHDPETDKFLIEVEYVGSREKAPY